MMKKIIAKKQEEERKAERIAMLEKFEVMTRQMEELTSVVAGLK